MAEHRGILISEDVVSEPERIRSIVARRVDDLLREHPGEADRPHVVRLVVPVEPIDPFAWLRAQDLRPRIYWHGRNDEGVTAAAGAADTCFGDSEADFDTLRSQLDMVLPDSDARVRYLGGFRFDRGVPPGREWLPFGTFTFTLPRFEYLLQDGEASLACNLLLPADVGQRSRIVEAVRSLRFPVEPLETRLPIPISRTDEPKREGWDRNIRWVLEGIESGDLMKVVLARRAVFGFQERLDPFVLLKRLEDSTENCFHFGFQFHDDAFLGATPERLFRRKDRRIWTEAVAGTRPRGASEGEDAEMVRALLESDKDQREHAYVRESIEEALRPLCENFSIDADASTMKLSRGWHLVSRSRGRLKKGVHGSEVMWALHPTPAVGGNPTAGALDTIRSLEPFDRGWYTGPVGWIGARGAEFAVALRCGLVQDDTLSLYSGAGIVEGSDPTAEWAEIEQKISDFVKLFGLDLRGSG